MVVVVEGLNLEDFTVALDQTVAGDLHVRAKVHLKDYGVVGVQSALTKRLGAFVESVR